MFKSSYKTKGLNLQAPHTPAYSDASIGSYTRRRSPVLSRRELQRLVIDMVG
ncbi:MAG: hypothetical protein RIQ75_2077 [Pseudomonadota bacterium]|jgi:hypothetical protein